MVFFLAAAGRGMRAFERFPHGRGRDQRSEKILKNETWSLRTEAALHSLAPYEATIR
jgi:hypothetical protein